MKKKKRTKTGIKGLDEVLNGGIPKNSSVLVAGPSGSGKTTCSIEFLYKGITEHNQNGLYLSFEEYPKEIKKNLPFDWNLDKLEEENKLSLVKYDPFQYEDIIDLIRNSVKEVHAQRVAIDSLTALSLYVGDVKDIRKLILDINEQLRKLQCTSIYTGEIKNDAPEQISRFGVEEFIADGIIKLFLTRKRSELKKGILVRKMRGTNHDKKIHPLDIGDDGIRVFSEEEAFSETTSEDLF